MLFKIIIFLFILQVNALDKENGIHIITNHYPILLNIAWSIVYVLVCCITSYLLYIMSMSISIPTIQESIDEGYVRQLQDEVIVQGPEQLRRAQRYRDVAYEAELNGNIYRAAMAYGFASSSYRAIGDITNAIETLGRAASMYKQQAERFHDQGNYYIAAWRYISAANAYKELGNLRKSKMMFMKAALVHELHASRWFNSRRYGTAAIFYKQAAKIYLEAGNGHKGFGVYIQTVKCYDMAGEKKKAAYTLYDIASICEQIAITSRSKRFFEAAGYYYERSADGYKKAGDTTKAIRVYGKAAEQYNLAGNIDTATTMRSKSANLQGDRVSESSGSGER